MSLGDDLAQLAEAELARYTDLALHIECNKVRKLLDRLDPPPPPLSEPVDLLPPMTDAEARAYGRELMGFGRYGQLCRVDVPREYLEWLVEEKRTEWRQLVRYLKRELPISEIE